MHRFFGRVLALNVLFWGCVAASASAAIIDHTRVAAVETYSQSAMNAIGRQTWYFTHASVGSNMLTGMNNLHSSGPTFYQLNLQNAGSGSAPATPASGTIYDYNRGNPGWSNKFTIFNDKVRNGGWHAPAVQVAMDKLCYIDQGASASTYITMMSGLETAFPTTRFVYTTMPLMTSTDADNVARNDYNDAVRAHCRTNNRLLFDIADIESHTPAGTPITFSLNGKTYQKLYADYTGDGGHLNTAGARQVALGWYATAGEIAGVPEPGTVALLLTGAAAAAGIALRRRARAA